MLVPQCYPRSEIGFCDMTKVKRVLITLQGELMSHLLFHYRLVRTTMKRVKSLKMMVEVPERRSRHLNLLALAKRKWAMHDATQRVLAMPVQHAELSNRSDFSLAPFRRASDRRAVWQLISTFLPIALLWACLRVLWRSQGLSTLLMAPVLALLVLFYGRSLGLMHDCGHGSMFRSRLVNRTVGFLLGIANGIPLYPWFIPVKNGTRANAFHQQHNGTKSHAFHHLHNGNWDRYRGPAPLLTVQQFLQLSPQRQQLYRWSRHPLMLFPGGFFYLVVRSRLLLVLGLGEWLSAMATAVRNEGLVALLSLYQRSLAFESKHWCSRDEFIDILTNTLCVLLSWWIIGGWLGYDLFWISYSFVMTCSGAILIGIFFVQHIFPDAYAHGSKDWSYHKGAMEGTSNLILPKILNWFTVDIAFHSIHHLCDRIPNYRLRECHKANQHLLADCTYLRLSDLPRCFKLILWDSDKQELVSIAELC